MFSADFLDGSVVAILAAKLSAFPATANGPGGVRQIRTYAGTPTGAQLKGTLAIDTTNGLLYINTDGASTWTKVGVQT